MFFCYWKTIEEHKTEMSIFVCSILTIFNLFICYIEFQALEKPLGRTCTTRTLCFIEWSKDSWFSQETSRWEMERVGSQSMVEHLKVRSRNVRKKVKWYTACLYCQVWTEKSYYPNSLDSIEINFRKEKERKHQIDNCGTG